MVQRKVPNRLGFQADHVDSEKRLGNLKPTSSQHLDSKSRGSDMRKKMKRSRSIKLSDIDSLNSSPSRKTISQPEKPATPQRQAMIKTSGGPPNYMKATTSSEARKERHLVSSLNTHAGSDGIYLSRRNTNTSRIVSDSGNIQNKSLTKSSSLKLVRTLTKSPSFKPARSAAKKCSRVALCADVNVHNVTCSSTLKDSNFPPYLMLNPGGTESEGTSVLKVCPYTYCSLNGHHHTPLPPLKCFLKAKSRSLKSQKSSKLEVSSPRSVMPFSNGTEKLGMDFFIEIYAKNADDGTEATGGHAENDGSKFSFGGEPNEQRSESSFHGDDEAVTGQEKKDQVSEDLSDASPRSQIVFEENFEENKYTNSTKVWIAGDFLEEQKTEASLEEDGNISETSYMEWEEGQIFKMDIDTEIDYLNKPEKEPKIIRSNDVISNCTEEILADDVLQELFDKETASCSTQRYDSDSEMEGNWETLEPTQKDADLTHNIGLFEEPTAVVEKIEECGRDLADALSAITTTEELIMEPAVANENIPKDRECGTENDTAEDPIEEQEQVADDSSQSSSEATHDNGKLNDSQNHMITQAQLEKIPEDSNSTQELANEIELAQNCDRQLDGQHESTDVVENRNLLEKDREGANKSTIQTLKDSEEQSDLRICKLGSDENETGFENMEVEVNVKSDVEQNSLMANNGTSSGSGRRHLSRGCKSSQELADAFSNRKWIIRCKKTIVDSEEERQFNPREPNFLPVVPDPEAEKVDLKHQIMDDRKNAEEWMLDYALRQAVTKLAPARKRKVALLVEAFETVLPTPKLSNHIGQTTSAFSHSRPIQACS